MRGEDEIRRQQVKGWALLKSLHPRPIDLDRVGLIRQSSIATLETRESLEQLVRELGLNDEALAEFPADLHHACGSGLRIWQYPHQFARFLIELSSLNVTSYLELGIRHGGSFVAVTEYLERFAPLRFAVGVDVIPCPAMDRYQTLNPKAQFWCMNSRGPEFAQRLDSLGRIDLVFIDSHHEEHQCRAELELLVDRANIIAFHDIANIGCPGVRQVWSELVARGTHRCIEIADQYPGLGPYMGIGLAISNVRPGVTP
jgi:hypothetical protein